MRLQNQVINYLVGLLFSLSLVGCKQKTVCPNILLRIDSMITCCPDSALYMLDLLEDFMPIQPQKVRMYHSLLLTKAKEKCRQPFVSDSLMRCVVDFYRENGPPEKLMEAYFFLACVYRDVNHVPYALEFYQKAIDVRTDYPYHSLKSDAFTQMGMLFTCQGMHFEATDAYRKACSHALLGCDSLEVARCYKSLAKNFAVRNKMDSTMRYYELAGRYDAEGTVHERIDMYLRHHEFEKARKMLDENDDSYSEWGDYYHGVDKRDSASIYYHHALDSGYVDVWQQLNIYRRLALYAEEQGRIMQALVYTKIVNGLLDSLNVNHKMEAEDRMRALYSRYETKAEMGNFTCVGKENGRAWVGWLIVFVSLVGCGIVYLNYKYKKRNSTSSSQKKVSDLMDLPMCKMVKLNAQNPDFKLNEAQWKELKKELDISLNGFTERLFKLYPKFNESELRVCRLLKLEISPTDIARIIVCQTNTVSSIRKRLYKKIHGVDGTPGQFDQFIKEF